MEGAARRWSPGTRPDGVLRWERRAPDRVGACQMTCGHTTSIVLSKEQLPTQTDARRSEARAAHGCTSYVAADVNGFEGQIVFIYCR